MNVVSFGFMFLLLQQIKINWRLREFWVIVWGYMFGVLIIDHSQSQCQKGQTIINNVIIYFYLWVWLHCIVNISEMRGKPIRNKIIQLFNSDAKNPNTHLEVAKTSKLRFIFFSVFYPRKLSYIRNIQIQIRVIPPVQVFLNLTFGRVCALQNINSPEKVSMHF